MHNSAGVK